MNRFFKLSLFTYIVFRELNVKLNISFFSTREEDTYKDTRTIKLVQIQMKGDMDSSSTSGCLPIRGIGSDYFPWC